MLLLALDISLRTTAAAAAVGLILAGLRVRSASVRHAAWSAVLIVMLAMPVLTTIVPSISVPVPSTLSIDVGTVVSPAPASLPLGDVPAEAGPARRTNAPPQTNVAAPAAVVPPNRQTERSTAAYAALTIYLLGLIFLGGRLTAGWMMARRLLRSAHVTALPAAVPVLESAAIATPLTVGIMRSVIVLPVEWRTWREVKLRAVLAHEEAHITRRDGLMAFLAHLNRVAFWFHPLAWWLPRTLAAHAEHACDDAAAGAVPGRREYAEVLVEIAESVSANGRRVAWQALGVEGTGLLSARIERLLRRNSERASRTRVAVTAIACTIALASAVACRTQPPLLQPDPELAQQYEEQAQRTAEFRAAIGMTLEQVDTLETRVAADPDDWEARHRLVDYYSAGTKVPWDRKVPGLRRHALWLIEHHPEHEIAAPPLSPEYDPEGFAQAIRLWDAHLQKPDASPYLVSRAARFFAPYDKVRAEQLLLRGLSMDPNSETLKERMPPRVGGYQWHDQLALLYVRAIVGAGTSYYPRNGFDPKLAASPYTQQVRSQLAESRDERLLAAVGSQLVTRMAGPVVPGELDEAAQKRLEEAVQEVRRLGRTYLDRALSIDPELTVARIGLERADRFDRQRQVWRAVRSGGEVPEEHRLAHLASKANAAYRRLEAAESWRKDEDAARRAHDEARGHAEAALALAEQRRDSPDYAGAVMAAHQTLGLIALHDGDREGAVRHLLESANVPELESSQGIFEAAAAAQRLPIYLLKDGERDTVIRYYEAAARIHPREREPLLENARAVREGRMPRSYQSTFAHPIFSAPHSTSGAAQR